ncbi:hypothetical protein BC827DRAFT_222024 [Russula dissimulans]|nr:hypothetical protein BC827DRAFT_222024 [Russula dissimulans]
MQTPQLRPSASTPPSHVPPHALTIDPRATVSLRSSAILTPPPSAHPRQLSHTPALTPPGHVSPGACQIQPQPLPAPRVLNPIHVSSGNPQHQLQQQLALHAENGVLHARIAPPPPPPQVTELSAPGLKPPTLQQERQQTMTHSTATVLAPAAVPPRPNQDQFQRRLSSLVQVTDAARLHGSQQAQFLAPPQAPMRGQQAQPARYSAPEMHTGPQRALPPHTPASKRSHTLPPSAPVPSSASSSTQSQSRSQAQQLIHQEHYAPATLAAFKVLQPAKALLEQSWATAIAAVQHELAAVHSEHVRAMREQERLAEQLKRAQVERAQANRALLVIQARLGESLAVIQAERKARLQLEHILAEMSKRVRRCSPCKCGERLMCIFVLKVHLWRGTGQADPCAFATTPSTILDDVVAIVILPSGDSVKASYC